jgi:prepilin-type N-terminal cleavage/methylation domain-containing protein
MEMLPRFTRRRKSQRGFSLVEMMFATVILLVGLVAIAQLVPASILLNSRNRMDSSALVFAQRELDFIVDQPLISTNFTDPLGVYCPIGNTCNLGTPAPPNQVQGNPVVAVNNQTLIDFSNPTGFPNWSFTYQDPNDPSGTTYDVRWAVIITGNGATASSKRFILGVRQAGGSGYFQPITLDTMVGK